MAVQATVTNTIRAGVQILTSAAFFANQPTLIPFEIDMLTVANFQSAGVDPVALDDTAYTVAFFNRHGYQIHSDQFLREIQQRQAKARAFNPCDANADSLERFAHFRVMLVNDPNRLVVLDCLPRSTFVGSIATSADVATEEEETA